MDTKVVTETVRILKNIPRTGWLQRGIPPSIAETVAEHSFEVSSILATVAMHAGDILDNKKLLLMGIIHDWGESVAGDIPRSLTRKIGKETKKVTEKRIMQELSSISGFPELFKLFEEYDEQRTQESIVTKAADLIATLRQALEYAKMNYRVDDIIDSCQKELDEIMKGIKDESIISILRSLTL
ncbi:MAG: HD family hydrolase [Candidatus Methanomethylicaceae archaeon]|nr:HD family hydrolase [Candidatus Verstraetearchaeota archaeon]